MQAFFRPTTMEDDTTDKLSLFTTPLFRLVIIRSVCSYLTFNQLSGTIPATLSRLVNLRRMYWYVSHIWDAGETPVAAIHTSMHCLLSCVVFRGVHCFLR